jgi:hypothetical protein
VGGETPRTEGETAFESYLRSVGVPFTFEEAVAGTTKRPDYCVVVGGEICRFEVKQFDSQLGDFGGGVFDAYSPLREKFEAARKKFKGLRGTASCTLVLFNNGKPLVFLDPDTVFEAMLGNLGITFPVNTRTGAGDMTRVKHAFLGGGKMLRYAKGGRDPIAAQNTTISAVVAVSASSLHSRRVLLAVAHQERALGRRLPPSEWWAVAEKIEAETVLRVRVYENPYAVRRLSPAFGCGPWDERFGPEGDRLVRIRVGAELAKLEAEEAAAGIQVDPWKESETWPANP